MLVRLVIGSQGLGIPGTKLAQGRIHKLSALISPFPDQIQILRTKEHRIIDLAEGSGIFRGDFIDRQLSSPVPVEIRGNGKIPVPGKDLRRKRSRISIKTDHFLIRSGPGTFAAGEIRKSFQKVGLSLRIGPKDHIALRIKDQGLIFIIAKGLKRQRINPHIVSQFPGRQRRPHRRGGAFCPAGCRPLR